MEFIIDVDGSVTEVKIIKGLSPEIDEEALIVMSKAPKWKPGRQGGRTVRVKMVIPIKLDLEKPN